MGYDFVNRIETPPPGDPYDTIDVINRRVCACCVFLDAAPGDVYCEGCRSGVDRNPDLILELPRPGEVPGG